MKSRPKSFSFLSKFNPFDSTKKEHLDKLTKYINQCHNDPNENNIGMKFLRDFPLMQQATQALHKSNLQNALNTNYTYQIIEEDKGVFLLGFHESTTIKIPASRHQLKEIWQIMHSNASEEEKEKGETCGISLEKATHLASPKHSSGLDWLNQCTPTGKSVQNFLFTSEHLYDGDVEESVETHQVHHKK